MSDDTGKSAADPQDQSTGDTGKDKKQNPASQDDVVTLPKKDYDNLVSQRDKKHEDAKKAEEKSRSLEERLSALESTSQMTSSIDTFLAENSEKYPDVDADDLSLAKSADELEVVAKRVQSKAETVREKEIENARVAPARKSMTPEEYEEYTTELKENAEKDPDAFGKMLDAQARVES